MTWAPWQEDGYSLNDGLGERTHQADARDGRVETLLVSPLLTANPGAEQSIRARAARHVDGLDTLAPVRRLDRDATGFRVVAGLPDGIRLSHILSHASSEPDRWSDAAMLELAGSVVRALAALHQLPGGLSHGAVSPAHVIITRDGTAVLTDGVFGPAVEALQFNREQVWRQFGLALPSSANLPRFDQRADVTQLGATVLAIALRRPLGPDEYPRGIADTVMAATPDGSPHASALRMWLQQALQLHARSMFGSAWEAQKSLAEITASPGLKRSGRQALQTMLPRIDTFPKLRAS